VNAHNEGGVIKSRSYITRGRLRFIAREGVNLRVATARLTPPLRMEMEGMALSDPISTNPATGMELLLRVVTRE